MIIKTKLIIAGQSLIEKWVKMNYSDIIYNSADTKSKFVIYVNKRYNPIKWNVINVSLPKITEIKLLFFLKYISSKKDVRIIEWITSYWETKKKNKITKNWYYTRNSW